MKDKVVVVTGASRGLGKAIAALAIKHGAKVTISARDEKELKVTAEEIGATAIVSDVTDEKTVFALASEVMNLHGQIDIWINNAGVWMPRAPVEKADIVEAHHMLEVNLFGTVFGTRAAVTHMKQAGKGTIMNIVSTAALMPRPNSAMYAASKYAVRGLTDSVREEVKDFGIKVIGVYPAGIKTELFGKEKPPEYDLFLDPNQTAEIILANLESDMPENELVIKRT